MLEVKSSLMRKIPMNAMKKLVSGFAAAVCFSVLPAQAEIIEYTLSDKPGQNAPPPYGLRLDNLFGAEDWTFSFGHPGSDLTMEVDTTLGQVSIFGEVVGGWDDGDNVNNDWADGTETTWFLEFVYDTDLILDTTNVSTTAAGEWYLDYVIDGLDSGPGQKDGPNNGAMNYGYLELLDDVDLDADGFSDQFGIVGITDHNGGHFDLDGSNPDVEGWLRQTDGFMKITDDSSGDTVFVRNVEFADIDTDLDGIFEADTLAGLGTFGRSGTHDFGFNTTSVPAPAGLVLLGLGLVGLGVRRRRQSK
jgi:hypothetical protein